MGDISVDLFLDTLKQLLTTSNFDFTMEEKSKVQSLVEEITYLRSFLRAMEKERNKDSEVMKLVVQIRDAVSEAENVVELFIVLVSKGDRASNSLHEPKDHIFLDLERVGKDIKDLEAEVNHNYDEMGNISVRLFLETLETLVAERFKLGFTRRDRRSNYDELAYLGKEIEVLMGLLNIVEKKRKKHSEVVINVGMQIKEVASNAEKAVKLFIEYVSNHASNSRSKKKALRQREDQLFLDLERVKKDIKNLTLEVTEICKEMVKASLHLFLETLEQLLTTSDLDFTGKEFFQLVSLWHEIKCLSGLLNTVDKEHIDLSKVMNLRMQTRDVVSDAEKVVKLFIVDVSKDEHASNSLRERKDQLFLDIERVRKDIKDLAFGAKHIYEWIFLSTGRSRGGSGSLGGSNPSEVVEEKVVVGFEEKVDELVNDLLNPAIRKLLRTISIVGPGGCGKTTLAREVYDHPRISMFFEIRAWVVVPQDYDETMRRDLLIDIFKSVFPKNHRDYEKSSEYDLVQKIYNFLKDKKYLLVMDNIWDTKAWRSISLSLPEGYMGSMVLFTSRIRKPFDHYVSNYFHVVNPLSKRCSWELLKVKVFGKKSCPLELVEIGKQIANKCEGLPLAIVAIAGILATNDKILSVWQQIAIDVSSIIAKKYEGCMELLELSYTNLPPHLKACFLYVGAHPEDYEISIRELTWLWIAEGFIKQDKEGRRLETVAEMYLQDLHDRNLVMIARRSSMGEIKTCRIHNLFRQLCLKKAEEENFFAQIDGDDSYIPSAIDKHRRLFIFRQFFDKFFFSRPYPPNLRSFLCLGSRHSQIELYMSFFVETFKLLRVFSFVADEYRGEILRGQLVHLRYLALRLPKGKQFCSLNPFHFLSNLEILNLQVSCMDKISLPRDIVKMVKLRHLYSKWGIFDCHHVCYDEDEGYMLDSLQTLHRMCICEHCLRFLERTPNLEKLGLIGDPDRKGDDVLVVFDLKFLKCLRILRVESVRVSSNGLRLPPTLTRLSLKQTNLEWEQLTILLQALPSLEVLKLLTGACRGPVWDTTELKYGFSDLRYLMLDGVDIKEWRASEHVFYNVEILVIRHCKELKGIPFRFAYLKSLREIQVEWSSHSLEESARKILERVRG